MSHFTTLKTRITDRSSLVVALADLGFTQVEVHDNSQHLYGYQGDARPQTAEVILRRRFIGEASNDIGFKRSPDGTFDAIVSEFDELSYGSAWLDALKQRYAYHVARHRLEEEGFHLVIEETDAEQRIHLVVRRMA